MTSNCRALINFGMEKNTQDQYVLHTSLKFTKKCVPYVSTFSGEGMMKPRFVDDMRNVTVEQGQDATFTCTISDIHVSIFRLFTHIHPCDSGAGTGRYIHLHHTLLQGLLKMKLSSGKLQF